MLSVWSSPKCCHLVKVRGEYSGNQHFLQCFLPWEDKFPQLCVLPAFSSMFSTLGGQISSVMCVTSIFFNVFYPGRTNFLSYVCYQHFLQCFLPWEDKFPQLCVLPAFSSMFSTLGGQISSVMCVTSIFFNVFYPGRTNFLSYVCYQHFLQCFLPWEDKFPQLCVLPAFSSMFSTLGGQISSVESHITRQQNFRLVQIDTNCRRYFNCLPNDNFLDWSKSKSFADDKLNFAEKLKFVLEKVESILEKMLVTSINIFSSSQNVFKRPLSQGSLKVVTVWERVRAHFE